MNPLILGGLICSICIVAVCIVLMALRCGAIERRLDALSRESVELLIADREFGRISKDVARFLRAHLAPPPAAPGGREQRRPAPVDPDAPHVFDYYHLAGSAGAGAGCGKCGLPENHAIHGYTGE